MKDETKEKASKIWKDIKAGLKSGFDITKKGLSKAGSTIQTYSDLGVVQLEKKQYESKIKKAHASLGTLVVEKLSAKNASPLTASDPEIAELLKSVADYSKEVAKREKILKAASKEASSKSEPKKTPAKKSSAKAEASK
jgi:hypothetical protein